MQGTAVTHSGSGSAVGQILRDWRTARGMSQLDLSLAAGVSARHISFVETGRAQPSREVILRLSGAFGLGLRDVNALLQAAGLPREFQESDAEVKWPDAIERGHRFPFRKRLRPQVRNRRNSQTSRCEGEPVSWPSLSRQLNWIARHRNRKTGRKYSLYCSVSNWIRNIKHNVRCYRKQDRVSQARDVEQLGRRKEFALLPGNISRVLPGSPLRRRLREVGSQPNNQHAH